MNAASIYFILAAPLEQVLPGTLFRKHCSNMPCNYWSVVT